MLYLNYIKNMIYESGIKIKSDIMKLFVDIIEPSISESKIAIPRKWYFFDQKIRIPSPLSFA